VTMSFSRLDCRERVGGGGCKESEEWGLTEQATWGEQGIDGERERERR
jgi:hypothetical protein